jgi:hypothetical protein
MSSCVYDFCTASTDDPIGQSDEDTGPVLSSGQGLVGSSKLPIGVNEGEKLPLTHRVSTRDLDPDRFIKFDKVWKVVVMSPDLEKRSGRRCGSDL